MPERRILERQVLRRSICLFSACLPLALVGACTVPGSGEAPRRVRLNAATAFPPDLPAAGWSLLVNEPTATLSLNTARIAIGTASDIKYLANGEWASRAPDMVMELLVESFKNSNRILTVGGRRARIRPEFSLELELSWFHVESTLEDSGIVRVALEATLIRHPRRTPVSSFSFESSTDIEPLSLDKIVAAFDESLREVMAQVVEWTLKTGTGA